MAESPAVVVWFSGAVVLVVSVIVVVCSFI